MEKWFSSGALYNTLSFRKSSDDCGLAFFDANGHHVAIDDPNEMAILIWSSNDSFDFSDFIYVFEEKSWYANASKHAYVLVGDASVPKCVKKKIREEMDL